MPLSAADLSEEMADALEQTVTTYNTADDGTVTPSEVTYRPDAAMMRALAEAIIDHFKDNAEVSIRIPGGTPLVVGTTGNTLPAGLTLTGGDVE